MKPLYQLPNGTWIDPTDVNGAMVEFVKGTYIVKALVRDGDKTLHTRAGKYTDKAEAEAARDEIARVVNEAWAAVTEDVL